MSGEIPMPSAPTEEAVKLARDFIDHHNGERMRAYREEADAMKRDLARRVDALVEAKVREATRAAAERAGRDAKGGEKEATQGTCSRCGYLAMPPACTKCYSPYPAPAPRDGERAAKGNNEGGPRG